MSDHPPRAQNPPPPTTKPPPTLTKKTHTPPPSLHPSNEPADNRVQPFYTKMIKQPGLGSDYVSDRHEGKIAAVRLSRFLRIRAGWPSRAVTRADNVHPNDTVVHRIKGLIRSDQQRPPVPNPRRTRERMTDQHRIVTRFVELAVDRIPQRDWLQAAAGNEAERFVICESEIRFECGLYSHAHVNAQPLTFYTVSGTQAVQSSSSFTLLRFQSAN